MVPVGQEAQHTFLLLVLLALVVVVVSGTSWMETKTYNTILHSQNHILWISFGPSQTCKRATLQQNKISKKYRKIESAKMPNQQILPNPQNMPNTQKLPNCIMAAHRM